MAVDYPTDPYPLMRFDYALEGLKLRFGADNVRKEKGRVTLKLTYPGRQAPAFVSLMVEQAKFLVAHSISVKDLVDENYPPIWLGGLRSRSDLARPAHRGAEPMKFAPPKARGEGIQSGALPSSPRLDMSRGQSHDNHEAVQIA